MKKKSFLIASVLLGALFLVSAVATAEPTSAATLTTPTLTSPSNGAYLSHWPRTTTLTWKPVTGATYYKVQRQYQSGSTWVSYSNAYVNGNTNTAYNFNFVGDQMGRWSVTAYNSNGGYSNPSSWWYFSYRTKYTLATPTQISPVNNAKLNNYPRATTLSWSQVAGATGYKIERQYYAGGTWHSYSTVTVNGVHNSYYTFNFVGDQPCRWRVTALDSTANFYNSAPSAWWTFSYTTKFTLATPKPISPVNNAQFYNYPRTTTLTWNQVPGATGYKIERQFYSGGTWTSYTVVTVSGVHNSSYTFNFVGAQPGRWRVTALDSTGNFYTSAPSIWYYFTYHI